MKRYIRSATESDSLFKDSLDDVSADFDYVVEGLEKLSRLGREKEAVAIISELEESLNSINGTITNAISAN